MKDLQEPEDIDYVENDARKDEQIPHDAKLAAGHGPVYRVHFVPVRRNAGYTRQKVSRRHGKTVQQKQFRPPRITHDVQEPPTNIITINNVRTGLC